MHSWTRQDAGTHFTPKRAHHFREQTRNWYVRLEKPAGTLTVKVYHALSDANAGNANFTASGSQVVGTETSYVIALSDNAGVAPVFTLARLTVDLDATGSTGNEVWKLDLGKKKDRAMLQVYRAVATKISTGNGYAFDLGLVELGSRMWEEVEDAQFPYVGIYGGTISSQPYEIGDGSQQTTFNIGGVAHLKNPDPEDVIDARHFTLYDEIRRAILVTAREVYNGPQNDGAIFMVEPTIDSAEPDKGITWARERATVHFLVKCEIEEKGSEIVSA